LAFQNAENDGFLMVSNGQITEVWGCFWGTHLINWSSVWASHWSYPTRPCFGYIAASATSSHPKNIFITTTFLWSHVPNKKHPQLNSDLNWPRPICLNWLIHQFWYPKWDSPKMTQFCWSHSFEIVAPLWLRTSDSSAMVPVWVLSIGSFVETRCAYVYACMCIWLLIKIPLSGNGHSSRIKMLLSRNFRELHAYIFRGTYVRQSWYPPFAKLLRNKMLLSRTRKKNFREGFQHNTHGFRN
jgi:hypothetical protein